MGIDEITAVRLFRGVPRSRRAELARLADRVTVPAGTVLARQDALAHEFFAIVEGLVEVRRDGAVVALLGPGDFLGEIALLGNPYRTATAVAVSDADLVVIARREFRSMLAQFPEIARIVLAKATRRVVADLRAAEVA
jgi:CRP/FNR family transcriptional regulator, cyclic AMP receptor protein